MDIGEKTKRRQPRAGKSGPTGRMDKGEKTQRQQLREGEKKEGLTNQALVISSPVDAGRETGAEKKQACVRLVFWDSPVTGRRKRH